MLEGEGHMLEGEPSSMELHGSSPPQATKEQPADSQSRGDCDAIDRDRSLQSRDGSPWLHAFR